MKKTIYTLMALAAAVLSFSSCDRNAGVPDSKLSFTVQLPAAPISKTTVAADGKTAWAVGDQIAISDGVNTRNITLAEADITASGASFTADLAASGHYMAIYPAAALTAFGDGSATITKPAATQDGTVNGAQIVVAENTTTALAFHNVASLISFTLTADNVAKIKFKGNNDETLAATSTVNLATATATPASGEAKEITVSVNHSATNYISVLPANLTKGFTITYLGSDDAVIGTTTTEAALDIAKGSLIALGALDTRIVPAGGGSGSKEDLYGVQFSTSGTNKTADCIMFYTTEAGTQITQSWINGTNYVNNACKYIYKTKYNTALRLYGGHLLKFEATKNITKIEFEMGPWDDNDGIFNPSEEKNTTIQEEVGTYTRVDDRHAKWEGSAKTITLYFHAQARISGLVIYYE